MNSNYTSSYNHVELDNYNPELKIINNSNISSTNDLTPAEIIKVNDSNSNEEDNTNTNTNNNINSNNKEKELNIDENLNI
jgi:hypothetical protein